MPYMSTDRVKKIREEIKKTFPNFKFSIRTENYSSVNIDILEGTVNFGTNYQQVNHFYIKDHYKGEAAEILEKLKAIANRGNYTESEDGDYGFIPSFYLHISIGQWDKPYKMILNDANGIPTATLKLKFLKPSLQ